MTSKSTIPTHEHDWAAIKRFTVYLVLLMLVSIALSWFYSKVLAAVLISGFFAYLINPLVNILEHNKLNRRFASLFVLLVIFGVIVWVAIRLFPYLYDQLVGLIQQVPSLIENLSKNAGTWVRNILRDYGIKDHGAVDRALRSFNLVEQALSRVQMAAQQIVDVGAGVMGSLVSLILVPILTYYMVAEKARLLQSVRRVTPRDLRPYGIKLASILDETLVNVVRGHLKVALALSCLYSIGFSAIGLSAGVAIGIAAGVCRVIPYLDVVVGLTLGVTYIFTQQISVITVFWLVGVIGTVQILDGAFITPKLIGEKVGLHPMVVILTVIAASSQFGFWGVLLAIPGAAVAKALYKLVLPLYRDSRWFIGVS